MQDYLQENLNTELISGKSLNAIACGPPWTSEYKIDLHFHIKIGYSSILKKKKGRALSTEKHSFVLFF